MMDSYQQTYQHQSQIQSQFPRVQLRVWQASELPQVSILYGVQATEYGNCFAAIAGESIVFLGFPAEKVIPALLQQLQKQWPGSALVKDDIAIRHHVENIFSSQDKDFVEVLVRGTPFQQQVWLALLDIPSGSTTTYGEIARQIGRPKASRAVGSAVGSNPVSCLIPCHRVLPADGSVGNYLWGKDCKRMLLMKEAAQPVERERAS